MVFHLYISKWVKRPIKWCWVLANGASPSTTKCTSSSFSNSFRPFSNRVCFWFPPCQSPGPGPLDKVGTGKILGPCTRSAWSWWNRSRRRWDGPNVSRACRSVRMGSSGCSSRGTQTRSAPRCRRTLHRDWAGCCAAEPGEWAKPGA